MFTVDTETTIAIDSPDHIFPHGTANDNHTSIGLLDELKTKFSGQFSLMDLGCSGGQFIIDAIERGNLAIGLEGSDFSLKNNRANWIDKNINNSLFLCDISRDFRVKFNSEAFQFNCITAWEVLEHIHPDRLSVFLNNIKKHLSPNGIFIGTLCTITDTHKMKDGSDIELHQSVFPQEEWNRVFKHNGFDVHNYEFRHAVREFNDSAHFKFQLTLSL